MGKKVLIVGGVAGGAAAATRLRRLDEGAAIVLFERGAFVSFANCGLPYYVGDVITKRESLLVQTAKGLSCRYGIDVRVRQEVTRILPEEKRVEVLNHQTGETYFEAYDALVLSPGASPINISALGPNEGVFTLRTVPDADVIKAAVDAGAGRAVVIGGGFIGIEMAENLSHRGVAVTVVEKFSILVPFDEEMSNYLRFHMQAKGVAVLPGVGVERVERQGNENAVVLDNGETLLTDIVIMSIGVRPENALAKAANIALSPQGYILVDAHMRTNHPDIYAVGDAVQLKNFVSGAMRPVALAGPAARLARILADNIAGKDTAYDGVLGTGVIKVFGLTGAVTGLNERTLQALHMPYDRCYVHGNNHAGYYPGASPLTLKVLFHPESGALLGAEAVGAEGTEKRVDVIAALIKSGATVYDLQNVDLCYAPPFGSAKDPANTAGFVAANMLEGLNPTFNFNDVASINLEKDILLDVRTSGEFAWKTIPGSINIPLDDIRERMGELQKDKTIYLYCRAGLRGYLAARILMANGYNVKNLNGGFRIYQAAFGDPADARYDPFWD